MNLFEKSVFFSTLLPKQYPDLFEQLEKSIGCFGYKVELIPGTKDIWARDFMPHVCADGKLIAFRYEPDYLQEEKYHGLQSDPKQISSEMGLEVTPIDLILDGGNLIRYKKTLILTDKALVENPKESRQSLTEKLKTYFLVEKVVLIPWDKSEYLGHADGMIRLINENSVLFQGYFKKMSQSFQKQFFGALEEAEVDCKELNFEVATPDKNNWAYLNYLQTPDFILVPRLGIPEDEIALELIRGTFTTYSPASIVPIYCTKLIQKGGGGLNCISWNPPVF